MCQPSRLPLIYLVIYFYTEVRALLLSDWYLRDRVSIDMDKTNLRLVTSNPRRGTSEHVVDEQLPRGMRVCLGDYVSNRCVHVYSRWMDGWGVASRVHKYSSNSDRS